MQIRSCLNIFPSYLVWFFVFKPPIDSAKSLLHPIKYYLYVVRNAIQAAISKIGSHFDLDVAEWAPPSNMLPWDPNNQCAKFVALIRRVTIFSLSHQTTIILTVLEAKAPLVSLYQD